ncbi:MAG: PAS domain S-box protein, partial [Planctomycetota bacterium]|nr:PAS domain S-box protein [Planctomycetota bacterium]
RSFSTLIQAPDGELYAGQKGALVPVTAPSQTIQLDLPQVFDSQRLNERMTMIACEDATRLLVSGGPLPGGLSLITDITVRRPRSFAQSGLGSWFGTDRQGLVCIERTPAFRLLNSAGEPLVYARHVLQLGDDDAIIQPAGAPPLLFSQEQATKVGSMEEIQFDGMSASVVSGCTPLRSGASWVSSPAGVLRLEGRTLSPTSSARGPVAAVVETAEGEVWASEAGRFFEVLPDGSEGRSLPGFDPAPSILTAAPGGFLFAVAGGVYKIETSRDAAASRLLALGPAMEPRALRFGPEGGAWLTTYGDGLFQITAGEVRQFTTESGFNSDYLGWLNFSTDRNGRPLVRINSNQGLLSILLEDLLDPDTRNVPQLLFSHESEGPSGALLDCGTILLPTLNGLLGYSLGENFSPRSPPLTVVDAVVVNGRAMDDPGGFVREATVQGSADIVVGFKANAMPSSEEATFSYRMVSDTAAEASTGPWTDSYSARSAQYFNLPPGEYTFQVRSRLPDTHWSEPRSVKVATIIPHFYQRQLFRVGGVALLLFVASYGYVRFRHAEGTSQQLSSEVKQSREVAAQATQREERYAHLLDSAYEGIVLIEADERISFANQAMTRCFGFEREELLQKDATWLGILNTSALLETAGSEGSTSRPPSLLTRNVQVMDKSGAPHESELVAARTVLDGKACVLVVVRDLSADRLLRSRLNNSERRFQALFQGAPAALITFSSDLLIVDRNRRARALLDLDQSKPQELSQAFQHGTARDGFEQQVEETVRSGEETVAIHTTAARGGDRRRMSWTISPLTTDCGRVNVLMAVAKDLREEESAKARLVDLQRRLAKAQESERSRIAREIHDDLSQRMAATTMNAASIRSRLPEAIDQEVPMMMDGLHDDLDRLTTDIHALSRQLHPTVLDDLGLAHALDSECARQGGLTAASLVFKGPESPLEIPSDVALAFFRIAQEAIRNATKHGRPSWIEVHLTPRDTRLRLEVRDDGSGFDTSVRHQDSHAGLGLISMEERARLIGATLSIESSPGAGTVVAVDFALRDNSAS